LPLGLRRVVVAMRDPNPRVRGRGIARLRRARIPVVVGPGEREARILTEGYCTRMRHGRPMVTLKLALTLDGRIAARGGDARWITGPSARLLAHALRDVSDAVLVGAGTVRADDPRLTCRLPGGRDPIRVVLSGRRLALPPRAHVLRGGPPTWVVVPRGAPAGRLSALLRRGVEVIPLPGRRGRVPFAAVARALAERGITSLLVEGGATVAAEALRARVVDRVVLFMAPAILGGDGVPAVGPLDLRRVADALRLDVLAVGPVVRELSGVFDRYWNSASTVPIAALVGRTYGAADPVFSSPGANATLLESFRDTASGPNSSEDQGPRDADFLRRMLNMTRSEKPPVLVPLAGGITDIRFFRVLIDGARIGIHLKP